MLSEVYKKLLLESEWIRGKFLQNSSAVISLKDDSAILVQEMCVIRLHDAWARFCRDLIITSASCQPVTISGIKLKKAPSIKTKSDVIPVLLATYKKRNNEPNWYDAQDCIDAAKRLKIQNYFTILNAIGSTTSPANNIRITRNFFAHRSKATANIILKQKWHILKNFDPYIILNSTFNNITLFEIWINDIQLVASAAIQ